MTFTHRLIILPLFFLLGFQSPAEAKEGTGVFTASQAEEGVLRIIVAQKKDRSIGYSSGSGFYIGNDIFVTNHHVIAKADRTRKLVAARKIDTKSIELLDATVIWKNKELDIAILKIPGTTCTAQTLSEAPIEKGSRAYAVGYPTSAEASRRSGSNKMGKIEVNFINLIYSGKRGTIKNADHGLVQFLDATVSSGEIRKLLTRKWQPEYATELEVIDHDVNIGHGNSGGPLFDQGGRIIGINTQGLDAGTIKGLSLADNVKNSARITELIKVLKSRDIDAKITAEPFLVSTPLATTTTTVLEKSAFDWKIWTVLILVGLAAVASLIVAMFKKPSAESYTHYLKRVSGVSRVHARPSASATDTASPPTLPSSSEPASPVKKPETKPEPIPTSWTLQGTNPEEGKSPNVHFQITPEKIHRYHGELSLGRKASAARLVIDNTSISKSHAVLSYQEPYLLIRDNGSSNGTKVNGSPVSPGQKKKLRNGDQVQLGEVTLTISIAHS